MLMKNENTHESSSDHQVFKNIHAKVNDIPIPEIDENEVLVKVKAAAVNPLEMLIITGSVKLIQDYEFPLTLGNELTGVIEKIGKNVTEFHVGDAIYTRLPLKKIGALRNMPQLMLPQLHPCQKFVLRGSRCCTTGWTHSVSRST